MKNIIILCVIFAFMGIITPARAEVSEFIGGMDSNAARAGITKYILSRGGSIRSAGSYNSNMFKGYEVITENGRNYIYQYTFSLEENEAGVNVKLRAQKSLKGDTPSKVDENVERLLLNNMVSSIKGRFLYGLGFDYDYYDSENGKIKAPKGKNTGGIKLTAVKYDAAKKGLMTGDIITEINGVAVEEIPVVQYSTILQAKSLTDTLTLKYKRGNETGEVTLTPRNSNARVF